MVLDGNHPLAGMSLRLALKVRDVREATAEEIEARLQNVAVLAPYAEAIGIGIVVLTIA